ESTSQPPRSHSHGSRHPRCGARCRLGGGQHPSGPDLPGRALLRRRLTAGRRLPVRLCVAGDDHRSRAAHLQVVSDRRERRGPLRPGGDQQRGGSHPGVRGRHRALAPVLGIQRRRRLRHGQLRGHGPGHLRQRRDPRGQGQPHPPDPGEQRVARVPPGDRAADHRLRRHLGLLGMRVLDGEGRTSHDEPRRLGHGDGDHPRRRGHPSGPGHARRTRPRPVPGLRGRDAQGDGRHLRRGVDAEADRLGHRAGPRHAQGQDREPRHRGQAAHRPRRGADERADDPVL
ncbi:MAG: hypothetical protein AVDCRST_MAG06-2152, partial [uncultured Nocardioides sp.]